MRVEHSQLIAQLLLRSTESDLPDTEGNRFKNDSETTVYQIDIAHVGISNFAFARHEIIAVNVVHVDPTAIRIQ